jgi:acyl transferase domain-containing protein
LSPQGRCYTFDERACGYGRGEGVGGVLIKPLDAAIRDGDSIRAIIRNTIVNQDGKTAGLTVPSAAAQEEAIRKAYTQAGLELEADYVEAHGTGTAVGDPVSHINDLRYLWVSSEVAYLTKVRLRLKRLQLPYQQVAATTIHSSSDQ